MKITQAIKIDENKVTASITVAELGDSTRDSITELNQLHNFSREIEFSRIDFTANMKIVNNMPVVTTDPVDGSTVEEITIKDLINKKYPVDENLAIEQTFDTLRIADAEYSSKAVFNSPELLGQAYAVLFIEKVKSTISEKLAEIRALANDIEKETDVVLPGDVL